MEGVTKNSKSLLMSLSIDQLKSRFQDTLDVGDIGDQVTTRKADKVGEEKQVEHDLVAERMSRVKVHLIKTVDKQTAHVW